MSHAEKLDPRNASSALSASSSPLVARQPAASAPTSSPAAPASPAARSGRHLRDGEDAGESPIETSDAADATAAVTDVESPVAASDASDALPPGDAGADGKEDEPQAAALPATDPHSTGKSVTAMAVWLAGAVLAAGTAAAVASGSSSSGPDTKPEGGDPKPEKPTPEDPKPQDPKPEDPKPEDPKPEDPTPEDPKPEDPKPEDPKPEDPKPEDPQPEDPTPQDPKPEDPKPGNPGTDQPEDPKPEDPTPEDPKPEDPRPEDPTPEVPTPEDPKPEEPGPQDPQPEDPKPEQPEPEQPKPEDPQPEDPTPEDPRPEDPKPEDPKPENPTPEPEDPKPEEPKPEEPKPEEPKPEDPRPEDPKPEDPKPEDPKPEDPKPENPKPEDPKPEPPKPVAPTLTLHSPNAIGDKLLGAAGEIRIGGLEPGARWEFSLDNGKTWLAGVGTTLSPSLLGTDGSKSLMVAQIGAQGGRSPEQALLFDMDTVPPASPSPTLWVDTGLSGTDNVTRNGWVNVGGLEPGARWQYSLDDGVSWWNGTGMSIEASQIGADGAKHVRVRQTDLAGNEGAESSLRFVLDTRAADVHLSLATDSGLSATDGVTQVATVRVVGLEPGVLWEYRIDNGSWRTGTGDTIPATEFDGVNGLRDVEVRHVDVAGNHGTAALSFTLDTRASTPTGLLLVDSGKPGDRLTNDPTVLIGGLEAGALWDYRINGGEWQRGGGDRIDAHAFQAQADGAQRVEIRQTDVAGNQAATVVEFQLDRSVAKPTVALINDTGVHDDRITREGALTVTGIESGATWEYRIDGGAWLTGSGNRIVDAALEVEGARRVDVRQTDLAGNVGTTSFEYLVDRSSPAPTVRLINDTGARGDDRLTSDARVTIEGLEHGAYWEYSRDGVNWKPGVGNTIPAEEFIGDGSKRVVVRQIDGAGNVSEPTELVFTLDTQVAAPGAELSSLGRENFPNVKPDWGGVGTPFPRGDLASDFSWIQLALEDGTAWLYSTNGGQDYRVGTGNRLDLSLMPKEGAQEIRIRQQDAAGNWSQDSVVHVTMDRTAPVVSGQYFSPVLGDGGQAQRYEFTASEDVQLLFIPVGTANDGSAQSYLREWRGDGALIDASNTSMTLWRPAPNDTCVVIAVDAAGNASFVSMGGIGGDGRTVNAVTVLDGHLMNNNVVIAKPDFADDKSTARATTQTDHMFGSAGADTFIWSGRGNPSAKYTDWIHDYSHAQGDVIRLDGLIANFDGGDRLSHYLRKEVLADGTLSLWIDFDGAGQTGRDLFDQRILVTSMSGTELSILLGNGSTVVI